METLLLVITVGSLVFALAMCALAWRMSQDERRRTAARVAQLAAEAAIPVPGAAAPLAAAAPTAAALAAPRQALWSSPPAPAASDTTVVVERGAAARADTRAAQAERPARHQADFVKEPLADELQLSSGFLGTPNRAPESAGRQRGLAAAAAVLAVGLVAFGIYEVAGPGAQSAASARAAAEASPLELLSLRHERVGSRLSVSGLVKNPAAGQAVERLYAVVFVFDQAGTFVTSGRAPVDFIRVGAGDESPFVVALDAPANVARYRVSFRTDAGTVPHVDKRGASPVAAAPLESAEPAR
jgi:hypothetical protein